MLYSQIKVDFDFEKYKELTDRNIVLAFDDNKELLGFVILICYDDGSCRISKLYVICFHKQFRWLWDEYWLTKF